MSSALLREIEAIQNPGLGGVLLWRFALGYANARRVPSSAPLPVLFLPISMLFHEQTFAIVSSTQERSGLRGFVAKFSDSGIRESDVLLSLDRRVRELRPLSLDALRLAVASRLLFIDPETAEVVPLSGTAPSGIPESVRGLVRNAEKLGAWCGGVTTFELASLLRISF